MLEEQTAVQKLLSRSNTQVEVLIDLQRRVAVVEEQNDIESETITITKNSAQLPASKSTPILGKRSRIPPEPLPNLTESCKATKRYLLLQILESDVDVVLQVMRCWVVLF